MEKSGVARQSERLLQRGFVVLDGLSAAAVDEARRCIVDNAHLLKNTRPNPASGHLAGFHRYPELEHLHALVSSNPAVLEILKGATACPQVRSIGLSDITMNRSQRWHVDLLRGKYQRHLSPELCWGPDGGGVYKVLLYLQAGATLRVQPGAHKTPIALDDDRKSEPRVPAEAEAVDVPAGGLVVMDIRLPHRGSSEVELSGEHHAQTSKLLISTVLAGDRKPLGQAMERGNLERLLDWDAAHRQSGSPVLPSRDELVEFAA